MERQEIDIALEELEQRLDRLRALYEQYFLGIEKIEPTVVRKDVDRRFWLLRRSQIRNTAKRFKLQTLVQRYNTFQQYWARICREIENGTYSRHLIKAQKNFGAEPLTWAAKKRMGLLRKDRQEQAEDQRRARAATEQAEADLAAMLDSGNDPVEEAKRALEAALKTGGAGAKAEPVKRAVSQSRRPRPSASVAPLELDMDELEEPITPARPAPPVRAAPAAPPAPAPRGSATPEGQKDRAPPQARRPPPLPKPRSAQKAHPKSHAETRARPPLPKPRAGGARRLPLPGRPSTAGGGGASPGAPGRAAGEGPAAGPPQPMDRPATAAKPLEPSRRPTRENPRPVPARSGGENLSEARVRELHSQLVAAKRKLNQGADKVSVDGLAKSLRATEQKLKSKHKGHRVDFEVVVRDGRALLKPLVRK